MISNHAIKVPLDDISKQWNKNPWTTKPHNYTFLSDSSFFQFLRDRLYKHLSLFAKILKRHEFMIKMHNGNGAFLSFNLELQPGVRQGSYKYRKSTQVLLSVNRFMNLGHLQNFFCYQNFWIFHSIPSIKKFARVKYGKHLGIELFKKQFDLMQGRMRNAQF